MKRTKVWVFLLASGFLSMNLTPLIYAAFMDNGFGARPMGMGGAFSGIADDSNAAIWNPAGLGMLTRTQANFMYA